MKKDAWFILLVFCLCLSLSLPACAPAAAETVLASAAPGDESPTAAAATLTATITPAPSDTPQPSRTAEPAGGSTRTPTLSPYDKKQTHDAKFATVTQQNLQPTQEAESLLSLYYLMLHFDIVSQRIIQTADLWAQGGIEREQADARLQTYHHLIRRFKVVIGMRGEASGSDSMAALLDEVESALQDWWLAAADGQPLAQKVTAAREQFTPLLESTRANAKALKDVDFSFEQEVVEVYNLDAGVYHQAVDEMLAYEAENDIFQVQRAHRTTMWGVAPTVGDNASQGEQAPGNGALGAYTAPDQSFNCTFDYIGIDGDLLYDFIFSDRTVVAFTNDFGLGQAVERRPLAAAPANAAAARQVVDDLLAQVVLPALKQQHSDLKVLEQTWIESPRPMLQVMLYLPKASFIVSLTNQGQEYSDVVRGLWLFADGDAVYTIIHQDFPDHFGNSEELTEAGRMKAVASGLDALYQTCTFKPAP